MINGSVFWRTYNICPEGPPLLEKMWPWPDALHANLASDTCVVMKYFWIFHVKSPNIIQYSAALAGDPFLAGEVTAMPIQLLVWS